MNSVTQELANFAVETKFEELSHEAVHEAKRVLLDCIGCAFAGLTTDKGKFSVELARRLGGPPESTILGVGDKVSACSAAFSNGELINALDYDVGMIPPGHSSPCVVPASLALAEYVSASGKELILAIVLGHEISGRLGSALTDLVEGVIEDSGGISVVLPPVFGYGLHVFGGTASAGKILKLDNKKMANAFGIAGYAAPVPAMVKWYKSPPAAMTKYASTGWISQVGVTSALLAEIGYTGDTTVLDGEYGFWRFFCSDKDKWKPNKVTDGLGETWRFHSGTLFYKPYPCCGILRNVLDGFIKIIDENNLMPEDIETIRILSLPLIEEPIWLSKDIRTHIDAQFSAPFNFAVAAHRIKIGAEWQALHIVKDPKIKEFMEKVSVGSRNILDGWLVEVEAKGKLFREESAYALHGMTDAELVAKFENNASRILPWPRIDRVIKLSLELETVENISELMDCIAL